MSSVFISILFLFFFNLLLLETIALLSPMRGVSHASSTNCARSLQIFPIRHFLPMDKSPYTALPRVSNGTPCCPMKRAHGRRSSNAPAPSPRHQRCSICQSSHCQPRRRNRPSQIGRASCRERVCQYV